MKVLINFFVIFAIILIIGCEPNSPKSQAIKAKSGEQTMVVLNHIKFDKKEEFNSILFGDEVYTSLTKKLHSQTKLSGEITLKGRAKPTKVYSI